MESLTEAMPKPMLDIGGKPILWHLMKFFSHFGVRDFIVCGGYKNESIKRYFLDYAGLIDDFTVNTDSGALNVHDTDHDDNWNVTISNTGGETYTAGRLLRVEKYIRGENAGKPQQPGEEPFIVTYGDSLGDVNISSLVEQHKKGGKIATVTAIQPITRYGVIEFDEDGSVVDFKEKPQMKEWVNAGFFVLEPAVFDIIRKCPDGAEKTMFEAAPITELVKTGQLQVFKHNGYYQPVDTPRELKEVNKLWKNWKAPWEVWKRK
jgi:glucose-1-phosphate cytidylyltransferase